MRLVIDAERIVDEIVAVGPWERPDLVQLLDDDAMDATAAAPVLGTRERTQYLRYLRRGGIAVGQPPGTIEILVPDEVADCWSRSAARAGQALNAWMNDLLGRATTNPLPWEAAAASASLTLSEWCYARSLRSMASLIASPQERTRPSGLSS